VMAPPIDRWVEPGLPGPASATQEMLIDLARRGILLSDPVIDEARDVAEGETLLEDSHWNDLAAVYHAHSSWRGVRGGIPQDARTEIADRVGAVEPFVRRKDVLQRLSMTTPELTGPFFDVLLARRTTRSFEMECALPKRVLETVLFAVFGTQGIVREDGMTAIKRTSPSAGALHPIEAYVLALNVEGVEPGIYHYETAEHLLAQLEVIDIADARQLASVFTAGQSYLAQAHALIIHVARFERSFAKYSRHRKAYKTICMDSAHLSQTLYLTATHVGAGAFYTAAINDADISRRLGLRHLCEAPIAINGIGLPGPLAHDLHFTPDRYHFGDGGRELQPREREA